MQLPFRQTTGGSYMAKRQNLVIVRAGNSSLHEGWLNGDEERNWDLIVNYFGDDPQRYRRDDVRRIDSKGPKWPALHDLIRELGDDVHAYERVWLPDDDLRTTKFDINLFFKIFETCRLALAQPALTSDSHLGHLITLRNRSFNIRFTNFVEIMAPCFDRATLKQLLPSFKENLSGWGLDFYWPTQIADPTRIGIVDAVTVCHTRPVGGPNYQHLAAGGTTAEREMWSLFDKYGITPASTTIRGAIDKKGRPLSMYDHTALDLIDGIIAGYLPECADGAGDLTSLLRPNLEQLRRNGVPAEMSAPAAHTATPPRSMTFNLNAC
jgi:hypothetical protein